MYGNSGIFCESGNPEFWNPEYSLRNPETHQLLEFGIQCLKSGIHVVESSRIKDCLGFPYIEL